MRPDIINETGTSKIKFFKEIADVGKDSIVPPTDFTHDSNYFKFGKRNLLLIDCHHQSQQGVLGCRLKASVESRWVFAETFSLRAPFREAITLQP